MQNRTHYVWIEERKSICYEVQAVDKMEATKIALELARREVKPDEEDDTEYAAIQTYDTNDNHAPRLVPSLK